VVHSASSPVHAPTEQEIREQLALVLASPAFHGSRRGQSFLEYVCHRSLAGDPDSLKERTVAVEVFGRSPQSDLTEDSIVRVGAREVRRRLAQYYVSADGLAAPVRIDLPSGSYAPEFHYPQNSAAPTSAVMASPGFWNRTRIAVGLGTLVLALVGGSILWQRSQPTPAELQFNAFWAPVISSEGPLMIAVAHPIVYHPSPRAVILSEGDAPPIEAAQRPINVAPEKLNGSDLIPVFNQYVGFGDMVVATRVAAMLAPFSKDVRVRMASSIDFAELRNSPAMLVGAVTNRWTMQAQQGWRFQFARVKTLTSRTVILDTQGNHQQWSIPSKSDGSAPEDYLLICRTRDPETGGLLLAAAGLKQFGTEAAGQVLGNAEELGAILAKLPAGWESKNLQIVLHAKVIGNTPAQPEVVAIHIW
jgi:hypothetical protein